MPPSNPLVFPASDNGYIAQYPVRYEAKRIGPQNEFADSSRILSSVESRLLCRWNLPYAYLNDAERDRFEAFLDGAEGQGRVFRFFDPIGNLLRHSADLTHPVWERNGNLEVTAWQDPEIGPAFVVTNTSPDWRALQQSVGFGYGFQGCFSVRAKWDSPVPLRVRMTDAEGNAEVTVAVAEAQRPFVRRKSGPTIASTTLSLEIPPNSQIILAQPQLEIGAQPAGYLPTGERSGIVENAWLSQSEYRWLSPAPSAHQINLVVESSRLA
jgi:hypothetical protein